MSDSDDGGDFAVQVIPDRASVTVRPRGELDLATAGHVEAVLEELRESGFDRIVLDLGALRFVDSAGLHLALQWMGCEDVHTTVELGRGPARVLFETAGLVSPAARDRWSPPRYAR
jgi:anti-anti-sigma factor